MIKLPEELKDLSNSYLGESAWNRFVSNLYSCNATTDELCNIGIPKDMAKAIICKVGPVEHSRRWLGTNIPALSNYKPMEILKNYQDGERVIRAVLMRMP
ncbi:MAG: hypothetical protein KBT82_14370 [Marinobacter sp.]|uniref:hypothetical protein n=1 Tax=Marinobacter sp. TaxID=50741 RepID=UPI001B74EB9A|nr:hypothetical protein [Marinobacter sp.]MBQ0747360.1 hypothetical protein [Marinobacter sp.]MBQ0815336.1 hypothetical protein [Marinobacter sp.]|tara:strand:+ start:462 stop:761 length:300 start_codon:yes stop_codon:yes gene_type:complete